MTATFSAESIADAADTHARPASETADGLEGFSLRLELYCRAFGADTSLVTAYVVNETNQKGDISARCLFQCRLEAAVTAESKGAILPYPAPPHERLDRDEQSLELLYRSHRTFAVGHGCAATWESRDSRATFVCGEALPRVEVPATSPELFRGDGTQVEASMAALGGLCDDDDGTAALMEIAGLYSDWIDARAEEAEGFTGSWRETARAHLEQCRIGLRRMERGLELLDEDDVGLAFRLANRAVLLQQLHSRRDVREFLLDAEPGDERFSMPYEEIDPAREVQGRGKWRAFQAAFLLMNLEGVACPDDKERGIVELIWFPTGGGKTEAYLGLTAFSLFLRRLRDPGDSGTEVLMRYTLRLLTAQQFQRAAGLICAMERIRKEEAGNVDLGREFSIGIWVGSKVTPNWRSQAMKRLRALPRESSGTGGFLIHKCPWCGAQMGVIAHEDERDKPSEVVGYLQRGESIGFRCPDDACPFSVGWMPIYVVDEDVFSERPDFVIGTIDKFALLAWEPSSRQMFGLDGSGGRVCSPPGLIIQDELHLISGPLGSMAGLYEPVIEALCSEGSRRPKIVCSTATIRNYAEQVRALYGRKDVFLFPPPGLKAGENFFSTQRGRDGEPLRGSVYVGVFAPGLASAQTAQVRTYTALLQSPLDLPPEERDPWWTLLLFFNSLRELGYGLTLFQSDILYYLETYCRRNGIPSPACAARLTRVSSRRGCPMTRSRTRWRGLSRSTARRTARR